MKGKGNMERLTRRHADGELFRPVYVIDGRKGYVNETDIIDKLAEYEDLEEQNRLIKLPCAVGDTVYYADNEYYFTVLTVKVDEIAVMESNVILYKCLLFDGNGDVETQFDFDKDDFGKTAFPTREEAEAALKEL